jgi:hypothetical protein
MHDWAVNDEGRSSHDAAAVAAIRGRVLRIKICASIDFDM